jgi:hypothetical protein
MMAHHKTRAHPDHDCHRERPIPRQNARQLDTLLREARIHPMTRAEIWREIVSRHREDIAVPVAWEQRADHLMEVTG